MATLAPNAGVISLPEVEPDGSHLCFYDGNGDNIPDRDVDGDGLEVEETIGCLKSNISPLNPALLRADPESFLPDGFGPVNVILRFQETLPNEGCQPLDVSYLGIQGAWDPCTSIPGNDHFRLTMTNNANGFNLIGRTVMTVDDQIVYTSEVDPLTGEVVPKPMIVTGQLSDELGVNLTDRSIRVNYEMVNGQTGPVACQSGNTNADGFFAITCPLSDVMAGKAKVTVSYSAYDNNDAYRYENKTVQTEFDVFSNSTLQITEVGPFKSSVDQWVAPNGSRDTLCCTSRSPSTSMPSWRNQTVKPSVESVSTSTLTPTRTFVRSPPSAPATSTAPSSGSAATRCRTRPSVALKRQAANSKVSEPSEWRLNRTETSPVVVIRTAVMPSTAQQWTLKSSFVPASTCKSSRHGATAVPTDTDTLIVGQIALLRDRLDLAVENEEVIFAYEFYGDDRRRRHRMGRFGLEQQDQNQRTRCGHVRVVLRRSELRRKPVFRSVAHHGLLSRFNLLRTLAGQHHARNHVQRRPKPSAPLVVCSRRATSSDLPSS